MPASPPDNAARLDALYRAKARAEVAEAEKAARPVGGVRGRGDVLADVLLIKGAPGPEDLKAKRALAGEDGPAIGKALDALGLPKARYALCAAADGDAAARVRLLTEAIDPRTVVLLDPQAADVFAAAFGIQAPSPGVLTRVLGRAVVACEGFEASLGDEAAKRRVWRQLQALTA